MPGPNAIVGLVDRIDPPVDKVGAAELLRHNPDGVSVDFDGDQTARFCKGTSPPACWTSSSNCAKCARRRTSRCGPTRVRSPACSSRWCRASTKIEEDGDDGLRVELEASHARHLLKRDSLSFAELWTRCVPRRRSASCSRSPRPMRTRSSTHGRGRRRHDRSARSGQRRKTRAALDSSRASCAGSGGRSGAAAASRRRRRSNSSTSRAPRRATRSPCRRRASRFCIPMTAAGRVRTRCAA